MDTDKEGKYMSYCNKQPYKPLVLVETLIYEVEVGVLSWTYKEWLCLEAMWSFYWSRPRGQTIPFVQVFYQLAHVKNYIHREITRDSIEWSPKC